MAPLEVFNENSLRSFHFCSLSFFTPQSFSANKYIHVRTTKRTEYVSEFLFYEEKKLKRFTKQCSESFVVRHYCLVSFQLLYAQLTRTHSFAFIICVFSHHIDFFALPMLSSYFFLLSNFIIIQNQQTGAPGIQSCFHIYSRMYVRVRQAQNYTYYQYIL